jgi:hypothetical protein
VTKTQKEKDAEISSKYVCLRNFPMKKVGLEKTTYQPKEKCLEVKAQLEVLEKAKHLLKINSHNTTIRRDALQVS